MSARWYMVTRDGAATLCVDEADARETAAEADAEWPHLGPHRAVQLVEIGAVAEAVAAEREQCAIASENQIERWIDDRARYAASECAAAIRARKDTP